jgi:hypothetical protein
MTAAGAQVLVQVGDRLGQPGMMRPEHHTAGGRAAQAVWIFLVRSDRQLGKESWWERRVGGCSLWSKMAGDSRDEMS